jgi:hypothetical protein
MKPLCILLFPEKSTKNVTTKSAVLVSSERIQERWGNVVKVIVKNIRKGIHFQYTESRSSLERELE